MKKRYHSVLRQVVIIPMLILLPVTLLTIITSAANIQAAQAQSVQQDVGGLRVSVSQIENTLKFTDNLMDELMVGNVDQKILQGYTGSTQALPYINAQTTVINWMTNVVGTGRNIDGLFIKYPYEDSMLSRSTSGQSAGIRRAILSAITQPDYRATASWQFFDVGGGYLVKVKQYQGCFYGMWVSLPALFTDWVLRGTDGVVVFLTLDEDFDANPDASLYASTLGLQQKNTLEGRDDYDVYLSSGEVGELYLGLMKPKTGFWGNMPVGSRVIFILSLAALLLTPLIVFWLYLRIVRPLQVLDMAMCRISSGDTGYRIRRSESQERRYAKKQHENEFDRLITQFNQMLDALEMLEKSLVDNHLQHVRTKLSYVSRQIRPHFILNALNLMYTYEPEEHEQVRKMLRYLSEYFRYIVNLQQDLVELEKEFVHTRRYLDIQRERYPGQLSFAVEWEAKVSGCLIPPLIIQTFVENSIKYCMRSKKVLYIYVMAKQENEMLSISIGDSGGGVPETLLASIHDFLRTRVPGEDLGIGIQNAVERLDMIYDQRVDIWMDNAEGGWQVDLKLPLHRREDDAEPADG